MNFDTLINGFFSWLKKPAPPARTGACTCPQPATTATPPAAAVPAKTNFPSLADVVAIAQKLWNK